MEAQAASRPYPHRRAQALPGALAVAAAVIGLALPQTDVLYAPAYIAAITGALVTASFLAVKVWRREQEGPAMTLKGLQRQARRAKRRRK